MTGYLIRRILQSIIVLFLVTVIVFILLHLLPGGPARAILGPRATAQQIATFNEENGYNLPLPAQYGVWIGHMFEGNFGFSVKLNQSVASLIANRLPKTLILTVLSTIIAVVVAIPLGVLQAARRNKPTDYVLTGLSFIFYSTPTFFLGLLLILWFAIRYRIFPPEAPQGSSFLQILADPLGLVLPVATLTLVTIALFSRYARSSIMDNLVEDYVRTARAKGAGEGRVMFRHVLRNALIPIATLLGLSLPGIFSGTLITESVFNYPGMGLLFWNSTQTQDYPVLLGFTLVVGVATVVGSLLADVAYAALDPRVRYVRV